MGRPLRVDRRRLDDGVSRLAAGEFWAAGSHSTIVHGYDGGYVLESACSGQQAFTLIEERQGAMWAFGESGEQSTGARDASSGQWAIGRGVTFDSQRFNGFNSSSIFGGFSWLVGPNGAIVRVKP